MLGETTDRVALAAARLDAIAKPVCVARLRDLGEHESGAYNFYAERLARGTIFSDYELALTEALLAWPQSPRRVHEIGCGFASLSLLLSSLGFAVTALELDGRRFAGAAAIINAVQRTAPGAGGRVELLNTRFPVGSHILPPDDAVLIITNLVFTTSPGARASMIEAIGRYPAAIVDIDRFLSPSRTPEERARVLDEFEAAGLAGRVFLDLGPSACFYRFGDGVARPEPRAPTTPSTARRGEAPRWLSGLWNASKRIF